MQKMSFEKFTETYQIHLNEQQIQAVQSVDKPTLLLAVPGSGKTTVLVTRLGYMIHCCNIPPERILTVTYTVAATRDMKQRFASIFGEELAGRMEFRTINGICAKIIHYYGTLVGKTPFTLVTDEGFKTRLLSEIYLQYTKTYPTESDLKNISTWITYIKNMQLTGKEIEKLVEDEDIPLQDIYREYCRRMRELSYMDYDDQMVYALTMLRKTPEVLRYFQEMYPYICVDEAQDTSKIQHQIIAALAGRYKHLFMVGDEDQSIYGFRAAYPEALLSFEKQYEGAEVLLMEENFRSNARIVAAADRFIRKNEFRHPKSMRASRPEGTAIKVIELRSRRAQYKYLLKVAENCEEETAVLYRDNESILPVVDLLERNGIDYRMKNADLTFFSHRIVLDIVHIIRFAENPYDTELFMQIYYKIGTYMNKAAAMEACAVSEKKEMPVLEAALRYVKIPTGTQISVKSMKTHLEGLLAESASQAINRIVRFMGYGAYLERAHLKDNKVRIIEAIAVNEMSAVSLVERLEELATIIREKESDKDCKLIFSTIHSSKGLEYDTVYLMDAKDGIFPETVITNRKRASTEELKTYEEERRLYYVGVTRAKNHLVIFRFKDGSTFTGELLGSPADTAGAGASGNRKRASAPAYASSASAKKKVSEQAYRDKWEEIASTGYVNHKLYGEGMVQSMEGDTLEVEFKNKTTKCKLRLMMEKGIIL
jgi:DNA helicase-2/ATP-dependent DNA helicase PcrA